MKSALQQKGALQTVSEYVEDVVVNQHQSYHQKAAELTAKMEALLEYVNELEVSPAVGILCCNVFPDFEMDIGWPRRG